MSDNIPITPGAGLSVATDDVGGVHYQIVKQAFGAADSATMVSPANPLPVTGQFYPATQPVSVSGTVPVSGSFYQATQPVSIASMPSTPVTGTFWQATQPVSGSVSVSGSVAVTGSFYQATQPVSAASLPLPTGAATETTLGALNTKTPALGQATMANSQPVAIASNQSALAVTGTFWQATQPVSGTVTANAGTGTFAVSGPLTDTQLRASAVPVSLAANQSINNAQLGGVAVLTGNGVTGAGSQRVTIASDQTAFSVVPGGNVAAGATDTGNPVKVGGVYGALPTLASGQRGDLQLSSAGHLRVTLGDNLGSYLSFVQSLSDGVGTAALSISTTGLGYVFNGTGWDRARGMGGNATTGDTGAKTATGNGSTQTNIGNKGVQIVLALGAVSGTTPTLVLKVQGSVDGGTSWYDVPGATTASLTATGTYGITIYPAAAVTAGTTTSGTTAVASQPLPRTWRLVWTIGGTTPSFTFTSISHNYLVN